MLRVAEIRKKRNMTQVELAKAVGISQPSISDIETGNKNPAFETLVKLAQALGCSLDELVDLKTDSAVS